VENQSYPPPNDEELGEYLRELDAKLTAKMKAVSEALNQENDSRAPQTPAASSAAAAANKDGGGGGGADGKNESMLPFAKLQSDKLKKMLYHKMMLTVPDSSPRNVRVATRPRAGELDRWRRRKLIEQYYEEPQEADVSAAAEDEAEAAAIAAGGAAAAADKEDELRDPVVDRDTVKRLSNLIAQQSNPRGGGKRRSKGGKGGRDLVSPSSSR